MVSKLVPVGVAVQRGQCCYKMMKDVPTDV